MKSEEGKKRVERRENKSHIIFAVSFSRVFAAHNDDDDDGDGDDLVSLDAISVRR